MAESNVRKDPIIPVGDGERILSVDIQRPLLSGADWIVRVNIRSPRGTRHVVGQGPTYQTARADLLARAKDRLDAG